MINARRRTKRLNFINPLETLSKLRVAFLKAIKEEDFKMIDKNAQRLRAEQMSKNLAAQGLQAPKLTFPTSTLRQVVAPQVKNFGLLPAGVKDLQGEVLREGQTVARPMLLDRSPYIKLCKVTLVKGGKVYLDNSKQPLRIPNRVLIVK